MPDYLSVLNSLEGKIGKTGEDIYKELHKKGLLCDNHDPTVAQGLIYCYLARFSGKGYIKKTGEKTNNTNPDYAENIYTLTESGKKAREELKDEGGQL